jgi:hypothetical protein
VPTFCRHNRFIERCPICSAALPGGSDGGRSPRGKGPRRTTTSSGRALTGRPAAAGGRGRSGGRASGGARANAPGGSVRRRPRNDSLRIQREDRAVDDGYRSELLPGVRASADARRLAEEISFSSGRLLALAASPVDLYADAQGLLADDLERATWICFLTAYLCPLNGEHPFAGIRLALREDRCALADIEQIALGPRTSHDPRHGARTLEAYRRWFQQAGSQELAFTGDPGWSPKRRFERLFERLALPGFLRSSRFDMLVTMGRLGLYALQADSLHLTGAGVQDSNDPAVTAAKRVFAIGEAQHLERRSAALAAAISVPIEALDPALANWGAGERATLGFPADTCDHAVLDRALDVLGG